MCFDLTVNEFARDVALAREIVVFGEQFWRPYCHVSDFYRASAAVLNAPTEQISHEVFNVGDTAAGQTPRHSPNTYNPFNKPVLRQPIKSTQFVSLAFGQLARANGISQSIGHVGSTCRDRLNTAPRLPV